MKNHSTNNSSRNSGFVLPMVVMAIIILVLVGVGLLTVVYGVRLRAIKFKGDTIAMLAAEAGYQKAIFWMNCQADVQSSLPSNSPKVETIPFGASSCTYTIQTNPAAAADCNMPVYRVRSTGTFGGTQRVVDVDVIQVVGGWDMGKCQIPTGTTLSYLQPVNFVNNEIVDIPIHINKDNSNPAGDRDIYISGHPDFRRRVEMGESKGNKYPTSITNLFHGNPGIIFDQPDVRITDEAAVQAKINRFMNSTPTYRYTPTSSSGGTPAVQLEFFVEGGVGKVRITNNCRVQTSSPGSLDYKIVPGTNGTRFVQYPTYDYHYKSNTTSQVQTIPITNTYVTQSFGGQPSQPGGQIYVNGNVIIGGDNTLHNGDQVLNGKMTVVATGNIWIGDSIVVDGARQANGMPDMTNPNILGLIAQGVVKVVNPTANNQSAPQGYTYQPIGITKSGSSGRFLPNSTIVEAAITVGGGGWGAEEVYSPGRREWDGSSDNLIVRGTITEPIRGVVGNTNNGVTNDGYIKQYYLDQRLLEGMLPSNIWFSGKYVPAPAGWHEYRVVNP